MSWGRIKLEDLTTLFTDGDWIETKDQSDAGIRLIQTGNIGLGQFKDRAEKARYISDETFIKLKCTEIFSGDCLVSRLPDPPGRSCILPDTGERMITAVDCTVIRFDNSKILPQYFNYYSQSVEYLSVVSALCTGATRQRISRKNLGDVFIPVPSISEQKRIVEILDEAFEGIDAAIANTEKNLANTRELFESYTDKLFLSNVSKTISLENLTELITKGSSPKWQGISYVDKPGILFVTSENVLENRMDFSNTKYVEEEFNLRDKKSILSKGDVLTNIVGASIGRTAVFDREDVANINQAVCLMRCKKDKLINKFLCYYLNSPCVKRFLHENEIDNARANLSLGFFRGLQMPVLNLNEQSIIVNKIDGYLNSTLLLESFYQKKLESLNELKQSLLQKAFSGELTSNSNALAEVAA